jgi:geranylgeranyl diphosphate synthase, type II
VASACGGDDPALSMAAAVSIELIHCASLVHDDLPCFDNAALRRGVASIHVAYGERCAVLAGDALIVAAFETLAVGAVQSPLRLARLITVLAQRVGMPNGIVAGQAWECEDWVALPDYQRAKTGSLFAAATEMGALSAGANPTVWRDFGELLGEAYQVADDIRDASCSSAQMGKPAGQDRALGRPSAVAEFTLSGALTRFEELIEQAASAVPEGPSAHLLRRLLQAEALRLVPTSLRSVAVA